MLHHYEYAPGIWRTMMDRNIADDLATRWRDKIEADAGRALPDCAIEVLPADAGEWDDKQYPWQCQTHCFVIDGRATWAS